MKREMSNIKNVLFLLFVIQDYCSGTDAYKESHALDEKVSCFQEISTYNK